MSPPVSRRGEGTQPLQTTSQLRKNVRKNRDYVKRVQEELARSKSYAKRTLDDLNRKERELNDAMKKLHKERAIVEDLRTSKAQSVKDVEELSHIMDLGTTVLAQKNDENERLQEEVQLTRANLADRDATISSLNQHVLRMTMAPPDMFAAAALDAQAQQALVIIHGLRQEEARKDALIGSHERRIRELSQTDQQLQEEIMGAQKTIDELRACLETSRVRASESHSVMDSQSSLLERLMEENARLSV